MNKYRKIFSLMLCLTFMQAAVLPTVEKYKFAEGSLAATNFIIAATINRLNFNDPESLEIIKTLYSWREIIRVAIDGLKIYNHNDKITGIPWLIRDSLAALNAIASNGNNLTEKPSFRLFGLCDLAEALSIIYAAHMQPDPNSPATPENIRMVHSAKIGCYINSLARLINSKSQSKALTTLNSLLILIAWVYKTENVPPFLVSGNIPISCNKVENIAESLTNRLIEEARKKLR